MHKQMVSLLTLLICISTLIAGMPQKENGTDNRVGLDRPSTSPVPDVAEGNLECLLYGGTACQPTTGSGANPKEPNPYEPNPYEPNPNEPNPNGANPNGCECVPFYLCDDNNTIIEDGHGLLDIRIKDEVCNTYDQKCCGGSNIRQPTNPVDVYTPAPPTEVVATKNRCGARNFGGVGVRITGALDNEAQYGEFPWMVAIVQSSTQHSQDGKPVNVYQCGGSLIHPQVVLTGAHCVKGKENLVIRVGEWDTQTKNELYPTQDRQVREVITHEQFNNDSLINDAALLILEDPVDMSAENVGLICLPEENEIMDDRDCVASGWGKDQFGKEGKYQVILKRVEVPIVRREPCLNALRNTRLGSRFKLHESFICAGGVPGKDTCKGDGGSPLACPSKADPGVYVQAGIVAWGINCGTETPGVYVNVPGFVSWIYNQLGQRSISLSDNINYNTTNNNNGNGGNSRPNNNSDGYIPSNDNQNNGTYNPPPKINDCHCVPIDRCDDNTKDEELDISICGAQDQKCCKRNNIRQPDNTVVTYRPEVPEKTCGTRNFDGINRITGTADTEAQYGEFPWMVAVVQRAPKDSQDDEPVSFFLCGGSLIHPQVVLTGAHCVAGKNNIVIRAGEWDTQTQSELYPTQDRKVREVIIHEEFNNSSLINDPALLILEEPVDMVYENVGLICLPEENENMDDRDCVASGWGKDLYGKEGKYQVILKKVELPIVRREPCVEALKKTRLSTFFKLHQSFICAGGVPGKDTCKGDGGSPLACPSMKYPRAYVQAGIVAWGINCGTETPGVYVNVPIFVSWINNHLQQRNIFLS